GKSTAMREIALGLQGGHRIANIFLEEGLGFTALSYIAMSNNIPPYKIEENPKLLTIEQKEKGKELIKNMAFYRHFGSIDSQRLFNLLEYLVIGKGVEVVFLDHISLLISGMRSQDGDRKDLDILMTNLRSFTERTQAIVICATQLKRKQKSYNEGEDITEADSRGSGAIEHISDVIFSLNCNRNDDSPNDAQIKILKNRITGQLGDADLISYNEKTGRYLPKNPIKEAHQNDKNDFSEDLI
ncbi:MAG: DnaB-like helicase C-terminal domain-containing protein, partial [Minisyncoccia bacterium]